MPTQIALGPCLQRPKGTRIYRIDQSMNHHEKGTNVTHLDQPSNAQRGAHRPATDTRRVMRILGEVMCMAGVALALLFVASASADNPPTFSAGSAQVSNIHPTRFYAEIKVLAAQIEEDRLELATSENGPGTVEVVHTSITGSDNIQGELRHLTPATSYYLRFSAKNSGGSTTEVIHFMTPPVARPEIGKVMVAFNEEAESEIGTTSATMGVGVLMEEARDFEGHEEGYWTRGIETNGGETKYVFEYSTSEHGVYTLFTSDPAGSITVAEESAQPEASVTGLSPGTTYFVRVTAANEVGVTEKIASFTTLSTQPEIAGQVQLGGITATSVRAQASLHTRSRETHWHFDYSTDGVSWTPGAEGTFPLAEATEHYSRVRGKIAGLDPGTRYYVRLVIDNGEEAISQTSSFQTAGPPDVTTFAVHAIRGEALRALGAVVPDTAPVEEVQSVAIGGAPTGGSFTLSFNGETTAPLSFDARPGDVQDALEALSSVGAHNVAVAGNRGGPFEVTLMGALAGAQPELTADASALTPAGSVAVAVVESGVNYETHYHFQYVSEEAFARPGGEGGFAQAQSTPEVALGAGGLTQQGEFETNLVGADLSGLRAGETYHYRLVASNTTAGDPVVAGAEQTLKTPPAGGEEGVAESQPDPCPNEALRTGPSARLPDCRAYEQVTPPEKEGAMDIFDYTGGNITGTHAGGDGSRFMLHAPGVQWGPSPDPVHSNYFFTRTGSGWQMTSVRPPGEASPNSYEPYIYDPDLTRIGVSVGWSTTSVTSSPSEQFEVGQPGGPYQLVASIPTSKATVWAGASADGSKYVLQSIDRTLAGRSTGTVSGSDLYEWAAGQLRQLNVTGPAPGSTIGRCGAVMARGFDTGARSGPDAVSTDGAVVFFEAAPGAVCSEPSHLYARLNGAETIDLGPSSFLAASGDGSHALIERVSGQTHEVLLYDTTTRSSKPLFTLRETPEVVVSENLTAVYFATDEQLTPEAPAITQEPGFSGRADVYRYDIPAETMSFVMQNSFTGEGKLFEEPFVSPDGRYLYWEAPGVGGDATVQQQVFRYDSANDVVQCLACASPSDPEPRLASLFLAGKAPAPSSNGLPIATVASANGDYVFFDTPSALVSQDVNGEIAPTKREPYDSDQYSPSSDVYEWRRDGIDGCAHIQGCLGLITSGEGGTKNELLDVADEGRDVFFATHEPLVSTDRDTAGDVYDARVDGGFPPPPPRPVECEGDACSTPFAAPNDLTPSSATFAGAGDVPRAIVTEGKAKPKRSPAKKHKRKRSKRRKKNGAGRASAKRRARS